jgi:hypothetical protein
LLFLDEWLERHGCGAISCLRAFSLTAGQPPSRRLRSQTTMLCNMAAAITVNSAPFFAAKAPFLSTHSRIKPFHQKNDIHGRAGQSWVAHNNVWNGPNPGFPLTSGKVLR